MLKDVKTDWSKVLNFDVVDEDTFLMLLKEHRQLIPYYLYLCVNDGMSMNRHAHIAIIGEVSETSTTISRWRRQLVDIGVIKKGGKTVVYGLKKTESKPEKKPKTPKPKAQASGDGYSVLEHFLAKKRAAYQYFKLTEGGDEFALAVDSLVKKIGCPYSDVIKAIDIMLADKWHAKKLIGSKYLLKAFQEVMGGRDTRREVSHGGKRTVTSEGESGL